MDGLPAWVCEQCGEPLFGENAVDAIQEMLREVDARVDSQVLVDIGFVSTTTLTATVPAGLPLGVYTVTVMNPGGLGDSLPNGLTVQNPAPTLTALGPGSGPNNVDTYVVITGT